MSIESADEEARSESWVFHGTPVDQRIKATHLVKTRSKAALCCVDHGRLEIPENSSGVGLSERQQTLAGGNEACDGLVQISCHHVFFTKSKRSADQTESGAVLDDVRTVLIRFLNSIFHSASNDREISESADCHEKIPAQGAAARTGLARRLHRAEGKIQKAPAFDRKAFGTIACESKRLAAKNCFRHCRFLEITAQEDLEI